MILKGRESLIRLIGRRRRFLRRRSLITSSVPQIGCKEDKDEVNTESGNGNGNGDEESGNGNGDEEWVDCPVCGKKVRGEEPVINSHLGKCSSCWRSSDGGIRPISSSASKSIYV